MELLNSFILLAVMILLILEFRHIPKEPKMEEKIAYTKRILTNLIPITLLLVTDAENTFGPATGAIKRAYVIDELYKRVPDEYKKYVTEENLDLIIGQSLAKAKVFWTDSPQIMNH